MNKLVLEFKSVQKLSGPAHQVSSAAARKEGLNK